MELKGPNQALMDRHLEHKGLPIIHYEQIWNEQLEQRLQQSKPDVVMADLFSMVVIRLASRLNIPLVINVPGPNNSIA